MITFRVDDMSCNHCVRAITQAVQAVDARAQVGIDLASHRVQIESSVASADPFQAAITEAGYTPVVEAAPAVVATTGGCCCGSGGCAR